MGSVSNIEPPHPRQARPFAAEVPGSNVDAMLEKFIEARVSEPYEPAAIRPKFGRSPRREEVMPSSDDLTDAKIAAAEARTDTKFAQLIGTLNTSNAEIKGEFARLNTRMSAIERSTSGMRTTVILTALGALAIVVAIMAYGQTYLGLGMTVRDIVHTTVLETLQHQGPTK